MEDLTALALAAGRGDRHALERFVRAVQGDVWRYCRHLIGPAAADDVTQDTFARAIRSLPSFEARSSARTWIFSIARRACADWIRSQQRAARLRNKLELVAEDTDSRPTGHGQVDLDLLVGELSNDRREAFVLTQVVGMSYEEVAQVCGCPVGTIRSRVSRARLDLLHLVDAGNDPLAAAD